MFVLYRHAGRTWKAPASAGGLAKTNELSKLYEGIANLGGADFFDAGSVITTDGADGLHLTVEAEKKLGTAVASKVKEVMK